MLLMLFKILLCTALCTAVLSQVWSYHLFGGLKIDLLLACLLLDLRRWWLCLLNKCSLLRSSTVTLLS